MRPRFYKRGRIFHRRVHSSKLAFLRARSDQNGIFTGTFRSKRHFYRHVQNQNSRFLSRVRNEVRAVRASDAF